MITVKWNTKQWHDTTAELRRFKNMDIPEFVRYRARIVCQDLIKFTPPRGSAPGSEGARKQLEMGCTSVNRDIAGNWRSANTVLAKASPRLQPFLKKYIRQGNVHAFSKILKDLGWVVNVVLEVTEQMHDERRKSRGRASRPRYPTLVLRVNSLKQLVRTKLSHIGRWKSGWGLAANQLRVSSRHWPLWVRRHGLNGGFLDLTREKNNRPRIIMTNDLEGSGRGDAEAEIVGAVMAINERKMMMEAQALLANEMKRAQHGNIIAMPVHSHQLEMAA